MGEAERHLQAAPERTYLARLNGGQLHGRADREELNRGQPRLPEYIRGYGARLRRSGRKRQGLERVCRGLEGRIDQTDDQCHDQRRHSPQGGPSPPGCQDRSDASLGLGLGLGLGQARASWISSPTSVGLRPTLIPTASKASALARAVPLDPVMMAPAWPMRLPGGAVNPAT
jgi:hypothetical protein